MWMAASDARALFTSQSTAHMPTDSSVAIADRVSGMGPRQAFRAAVDGTRRGNKAGRPGWLLVAAAILLAAWTCVFAFPTFAQSSPFAGMAGRWAGGGTVTLD